MISAVVEKELNKQMSSEAYASFLYLSMSAWCSAKGLEGCANFFRRQSDEEREHMLRIYSYIEEVNGKITIPSVEAPPKDFDNVLEIFKEALKHEQGVTKSIYELYQVAENEKDYASLQFLRFFVEEQQEEEVLFNNILDKIELIGLEGRGLYFIDKELEAINAQVAKNEGLE